MKQAQHYISNGNRVQCTLCPHNCTLKQNEYGLCGARINLNGELFTENYGKMCSLVFDPIEKKPLYHFFPAKTILSVGTTGCNLSCSFCQNHEISQCKVHEFGHLYNISASQLLATALKRRDNAGIAFTYNEPIIWFEFVCETAALFHEASLKTVMVTNGYINAKPLKQLLPLIDAFNVDLKAFSEDFYSRLCNGKLAPVLNTLRKIAAAGKHLEITNLVIPGANDDVQQFDLMIEWIASNLGKETILHLNRYSPQYSMNNAQTSRKTLLELYERAKKTLDWVYIGNIMLEEGRDTFCARCKLALVRRQAYIVTTPGIDNDGSCVKCGHKAIINN